MSLYALLVPNAGLSSLNLIVAENSSTTLSCIFSGTDVTVSWLAFIGTAPPIILSTNATSESSYSLGRRRGKISSPQPRTSTHQGTIPQPSPSIVTHLPLSLPPLFLSLLYSHTWCLRPDLRVVTGACSPPRSCDLSLLAFHLN